MSTARKLSKAQISRVNQSGGFLVRGQVTLAKKAVIYYNDETMKIDTVIPYILYTLQKYGNHIKQP